MTAKSHCKLRYGDGGDDEEGELEDFYDYSTRFIIFFFGMLWFVYEYTFSFHSSNRISPCPMTAKFTVLQT